MAGRVVAITGAARGIGVAIAAALADAGARVAIGDIDGAGASAAAERIGHGTIGLPVDVADAASFRAFLDGTRTALGELDVLVNNAGIMWVGPYADEPAAAARRQLEVNVLGVITGMKLALPAMVARRRGHVVNIASLASRVPVPGEATYAATKHAVYGYSDSVRMELRGSGVHLSVVMPAVVETELAAGTSSGTLRRLTTDDVTAAVLGVLVRPRFEVFVPRSLDLMLHGVGVLPARARERVTHRLIPDQRVAAGDGARAAYHSRAFTAPNAEDDEHPGG